MDVTDVSEIQTCNTNRGPVPDDDIPETMNAWWYTSIFICIPDEFDIDYILYNTSKFSRIVQFSMVCNDFVSKYKNTLYNSLCSFWPFRS